jgi:hypothetical protein
MLVLFNISHTISRCTISRSLHLVVSAITTTVQQQQDESLSWSGLRNSNSSGKMSRHHGNFVATAAMANSNSKMSHHRGWVIATATATAAMVRRVVIVPLVIVIVIAWLLIEY